MSSLVGTVPSFIGLGISALGKKKLTRIAIVDEPDQFLECDATITATHEGTAAVTKHPVEKGSNVTDHIRREPETLEVEVVVTDTPILLFASLRKKPSVPGGNTDTRAVDAYNFIKGIKDSGKTVKVTTLLRDYESMAINRLGLVQDKDTGNIARMTIGFEEIMIATTQTVDAPEPANASRKPSEDIGKKAKTPATPAEATNSSLLFDAFSAFGG